MRIYELYMGPKGPTPQSQYYTKYGKRMWQVAAQSLKHAIYLAAHSKWRVDEVGPGIVGYTNGGGDTPWQNDDGTKTTSPQYRHYQTVKAIPESTLVNGSFLPQDEWGNHEICQASGGLLPFPGVYGSLTKGQGKWAGSSSVIWTARQTPTLKPEDYGDRLTSSWNGKYWWFRITQPNIPVELS